MSLDIEFTATHSISGATITVADVRILGDMQSAIGMVSLSGVDVSSNTDIDIAIDETVAYDVSATDPSITVGVKDNETTSDTNPRISITATSSPPVSAGYFG